MPVAGERARQGLLTGPGMTTRRLQVRTGTLAGNRFEPNREPLYKRLPSRDENGKNLSDFMMLIPGLRNLPAARLDTRLSALHALLGAHRDVVFADLNTPLNLLWVSVRARHGVISEVAGEIRQCIPEARLVGHTPLPGPEKSGGGRDRKGLRWIARIGKRLRLGKPD